MAFYPTEAYEVLKARTIEDIAAMVDQAIADGYDLVGDIIYDSDYTKDKYPYSQAVVKRTNTDPQYIADLVTAFTPLFTNLGNKLDAINSNLTNVNTKLDSINSKLSTANSHLTQIESNTTPVNS